MFDVRVTTDNVEIMKEKKNERIAKQSSPLPTSWSLGLHQQLLEPAEVQMTSASDFDDDFFEIIVRSCFDCYRSSSSGHLVNPTINHPVS